MTASAHFIRLLARNIASYNSAAPLALNSACLRARWTAPRVCAYVHAERMGLRRAIALLIGAAERGGALMLGQHEVMTQ